MLTRTVAELLDKHVTLDIDGIDRLYLNLYQPQLQMPGGVVRFFKGHRGAVVASTTLMAPMSKAFVAAIEAYGRRYELPLVCYVKGQRKDEEIAERLRHFQAAEGVIHIGVAQERFSTFRVTKGRNARTSATYPRLSRSTVMGNQYYFGASGNRVEVLCRIEVESAAMIHDGSAKSLASSSSSVFIAHDRDNFTS